MLSLPDNIKPVAYAPSDDASRRKWHANVLRCLSEQLGFANDFFYPLLGAAELLDGRTSAQSKREDKD